MKRRIALLSLVLLAAIAGIAYAVRAGSADEDTVAFVNGEPVSEGEFRLLTEANRSDVYRYFREKYGAEDGEGFWNRSFGGEIPLERLRDVALDAAVKDKIIQLSARKLGLIDDLSFDGLVGRWQDENERRKKTIERGGVIYGPQQIDLTAFRTLELNDLEAKLKRMMEQEISDDELMRYYELHPSAFQSSAVRRIRRISSTSASDYYGTNYHYAQTGNGATATWTPYLPKAGKYSVYYWLPDGMSNRAQSAPFTIHYNGGSQTYYVDQQAAGGSWICLGTHEFAAGTSGYVRLTSAADNNYVIADAIKFVYEPPEEYIVDNTSATVVGTWTSSTFEPTYYGTNYIFKNSGSGASYVQWTPHLPSVGNYDVYIWLPNGSSNRPTNAVFTVYFNGGSQAYTVDETLPGGEWKLLGTHSFAAGTGGYVLLTDSAQPGTVVIADAVKFVKR